jgi:type IV pilus assembly protein PilV
MMKKVNALGRNNMQQRGFTLIEVLVSFVVLTVGLLGVAGLQMTGMRSVQGSVYRYEAARLGEELTDRMRANLSGVRDGGYLSSDVKTDVGSITVCSSACTPTQLAENDLKAWYTELDEALQISDSESTAKAKISCSDGACAEDAIVTITIDWRERADLKERDADTPVTVATADLTVVKSFTLNSVF